MPCEYAACLFKNVNLKDTNTRTRVISRNLKLGGGYKKMLGGVNMREAQIYIKKTLKNIKQPEKLGWCCF